MFWWSEWRYRREGKGSLTAREKDQRFCAYWGLSFLGIAILLAKFASWAIMGSGDPIAETFGGFLLLVMTCAIGLVGSVLLIDFRRMLLRLPPYR